jgi:cell division protein FtsB
LGFEVNLEFVQRLALRIYDARRKLATAAVGVLALTMGWHVLFGANGMVAYMHKRADYRKLQSDIQQLQSENQQLQQQVERLHSDPETIEREAREQLRYARPGETIYTLPTAPAAPQPALKAQK